MLECKAADLGKLVPGLQPSQNRHPFGAKCAADFASAGTAAQCITARRQAEGLATAAATAQKRTAESEARFRHTADFAPVLIWTSETDTLCDFFIRPWLEFMGRPWSRRWRTGGRRGCTRRIKRAAAIRT